MPVYLLRHGESAHNISIKKYMSDHPETQTMEWYEVENAYDPQIRDADLTEHGVTQAQQVREHVAALKPSLVIMSPLTRNLRTGYESCADLLSCNNVDVKIIPALREHTYSTCDLGSPVETLQDSFPIWSEELKALPSDWWCHESPPLDSNCRVACREPWQKLQDRAEELCEVIRQCYQQHECIVVVGHAVLFYALTGEWLANCELKEFDFAKLRDRCACQGHACCCEKSQHT